MGTSRKKMLFLMPVIEALVLCGYLLQADRSVPVWDVINQLGFCSVSISRASIADFFFGIVPFLFFQIVYGTYLYEHFCIASVYLFSRYEKRTQWYLIEAGKLYLAGLLYIALMDAAGILVVAMTAGIHTDKITCVLILYQLLLYSAYLFITTLTINVLALRIGSMFSFGIVCGIENILCVLYGMWEHWIDFDVYAPEEIKGRIFILKCNPISQLVLKWHSSYNKELSTRLQNLPITFHIENSIILLCLTSLVCILIGNVVVKRTELLDNEKE